MNYHSKYKDYIRECIRNNKQIKITELSDDGIDTGKAIKEFENTFDNTFYLLYVYGKNVVDSNEFEPFYLRLCRKFVMYQLSESNLSTNEKIVLDLMIAFLELAREELAVTLDYATVQSILARLDLIEGTLDDIDSTISAPDTGILARLDALESQE